MITISAFIANTGITSKAKQIDSNPHISDMGAGARHWLVTLRSGQAKMRVKFSQGSAHTEAPSAADVLDCLANDCSGINGQSFDEWCQEYGYDTDSRKAHRAYKTIERQEASLRAMLGESNFDTLLWNTERL